MIKRGREVKNITWSNALQSAYTWLCINQFCSGLWSVLPAELVYKITQYVLHIQMYFPGDTLRIADVGVFDIMLTNSGFLWKEIHLSYLTEQSRAFIACLKCRHPIADAYSTCPKCRYKQKQRDEG